MGMDASSLESEREAARHLRPWCNVGRVGAVLLCTSNLFLPHAEAASRDDEPIEVPVCRFIEAAAKKENLPVAFLTRLIWQESSFRSHAVSPAGAQGIAQFMPGTADAYGVADPFDPEEAIPKAAQFLSSLRTKFGNIGLAAAAYNAGPTRVANWLAGRGGLPSETQNYVLKITQHSAEDWRASSTGVDLPVSPDTPAQSCLQLAALIKKSGGSQYAGSALAAFWGVQLAGNFSKAAALATFERTKQTYSSVLGGLQPIVLGGRLRNRGFSAYYRVRVAAGSRTQANGLCQKILRLGGACAVLKG
jgi:hypothetical protein